MSHFNGQKIYDVIVFGAGFAGTLTALEIAKDGYEILLIEAGEEVIDVKSTSYNNGYRLHTGIHYIGDVETAKQCLLNSIAFVREFPEYIFGKVGDPWRRGRYYIMSNSLFDMEAAKAMCHTLKQLYIDEISKDFRNAVFGDPSDFFSFLDKSKYLFVADSIPFVKGKEVCNIQTILGIETAESHVDIAGIKRHLQKKINETSNIRFINNHKVNEVSYQEDEFLYCVGATHVKTRHSTTFLTKSIVNCTWQNIEYLDKQLGLNSKNEKAQVYVRVKKSLLIKLPEGYQGINTCSFVSGPHCALTNLGNGTAVVTHEPSTNLATFPGGNDLSERLNDHIQENQFTISVSSQAILEGASRYIPALSNAKILEVRTGFVKFYKKANETHSIYDINSAIHRRLENGIEVKKLCYISHSGMKFIYTKKNADIIRKILQTHMRKRNIKQK